MSGGDETLVVDGLSSPLNFVVADRGVYFIAAADRRLPASVDFYEFTTGKRSTLAAIADPWWFGLALSRDQQSLVYQSSIAPAAT